MRINSVDQYLQMNPSQLANTVISCPYCKRDHTIPFREIQYGSGITQNLLEIANRCLGHRPACIGVIYDKHIEDIIQNSAISAISNFQIKILRYPLGEKNHHLEPANTIGYEVAKRIDPSVEILIGAGSGVICDLTKLIADAVNRPFIIYATANSMNAYTSISGIITENKFKISKFFKVSDSVVMDTDTLAQAPIEMTRAGMGDLAARSICNADFRLTHLLKGTWFCPLPYQITARFEQNYFSVAQEIGQSHPQAIEILSQANLVSGYSMTMVEGETSPSSGAEHVLSHFWDLQHELYGATKNLHGAQVGIGTLINLTMYDFLRKQNPRQFNISSLVKSRKTLEDLHKENLTKFGSSGEYLNQVVSEKYLSNDALENHLNGFLSNWDRIWQDLDTYICPPNTVKQAFKLAHVPDKITQIQRSKDEVIEALLYSNRYRTRYTILDLFWELGLFPDACEDILQKSGVLAEGINT